MTEITLLDGGMGQELIHRSPDTPTPLWSTQVMVDHPGMVAEVHRDFARAGATVATTNTYAIHRDRLAQTPLHDRFEALHAKALEEAADCGSARIAGSVGPLRASYRPDLHPAPEEAVPLFAEVATLLAPRCDLMLCETVASIAHGRDVLEGARAAGKPVWLAFTVSDEDGTALRSGEPLEEAVAAVDPDAVLVNCSTPEAIPAALDILAGRGLPFGAYANGFERITDGFLEDNPTVAALRLRRDFTPARYADQVMRWVDAGATIVGGCCEVGPAHIAEINRRLTGAGYTIV
ncbi:homocysteine S-methyltransferase family protein [Sulfitobacter sp. S190]|uniref:homocysteine S-methyltransferase family protein n=1 Tax=Sulfitobacter sp. S190 TaxID=2867022 RepID=UPI0021A48D17|nr:homocysteine S-methyltransferase family protein [Sulfitobacter sp. S190]UWR22221.1 homocysteine S-methyltransferase family protein [Sulfitobacter sp. S190]